MSFSYIDSPGIFLYITEGCLLVSSPPLAVFTLKDSSLFPAKCVPCALAFASALFQMEKITTKTLIYLLNAFLFF